MASPRAAGNVATCQSNDGTTTWRYTYDYRNQLIKAESKTTGQYVQVVTYLYDGQNKRVKKHLQTGTDVVYIYDGWRCIEEREYISSAWKAKRQFVFGGRYLDEELLFDKDTNNDGNCTDSGGSVRYLYCQNANWNVVALTDNTGAAVERVSYTAYGQPTVSQVGQAQATGNPFLFQGQRYCPETGLYYFKNRDYLPTLGRLVQRDREGDLDSFNVYELEQSAPVFYLDPTGLTTILVFPQLGWSNEKLKSDRQGWTALGQTKAYIFVDSACLCVSEGTQHSVHAIDPKSILVDIFVFIVMNKGEYKDDPTTGELVAQVPSWEGGDTKNPTTIPHTLDGDYGHEVRHENMIAKCVEANRVKWIGMFDKRAKDLGKCTGDGCCEKNQQVLNAYIVRIITNAVEATGFGHAGKHGGSVKDEEGLGYPVIDKPYPDEHYAQELGEPPNMTGGVEIPAKPE